MLIKKTTKDLDLYQEWKSYTCSDSDNYFAEKDRDEALDHFFLEHGIALGCLFDNCKYISKFSKEYYHHLQKNHQQSFGLRSSITLYFRRSCEKGELILERKKESFTFTSSESDLTVTKVGQLLPDESEIENILEPMPIKDGADNTHQYSDVTTSARFKQNNKKQSPFQLAHVRGSRNEENIFKRYQLVAEPSNRDTIAFKKGDTVADVHGYLVIRWKKENGYREWLYDGCDCCTELDKGKPILWTGIESKCQKSEEIEGVYELGVCPVAHPALFLLSSVEESSTNVQVKVNFEYSNKADGQELPCIFSLR